jgi:tetratricopeptide (TPR) repeat protein
LLTLFPDSVDYGLQLVSVLNRVGRNEEALETIRQLHRLAPPAGDDARVYIWEAIEVKSQNELKAGGALQQAMSIAAARGQKLVYANAKLEACVILQYSDHPDQAIPPCQEAYDIFLAAGNHVRAASALRNIADRTADQGRKQEALQLYERAVKMLREVGSRWNLAAAQNNMATLLEDQGELDRAEQLFRECQQNFAEVGDKYNTGTALVNIADVEMQRGDLRGAQKRYEELIRNSKDPHQNGYPLYRLADLQLIQGDLIGARRQAERSIGFYNDLGGGFQYSTEATSVLGEILMAQGDLAGARRQFQDSLDVRRKLGDAGLVAQSRAALASLSLEEGHPAQAETELRAVLPEFEQEKDVVNEVTGNVELSQTLLMQGKLEDAEKVILHASQLSRSSPDPAVKLPVAIQKARVKFAGAAADYAGRRAVADARHQLQSVVATARRLRYFRLEYEGRLALGELELKANPPSGRLQLSALAKEAHEHGLELVVRKATQLSSLSATPTSKAP